MLRFMFDEQITATDKLLQKVIVARIFNKIEHKILKILGSVFRETECRFTYPEINI